MYRPIFVTVLLLLLALLIPASYQSVNQMFAGQGGPVQTDDDKDDDEDDDKVMTRTMIKDDRTMTTMTTMTTMMTTTTTRARSVSR